MKISKSLLFPTAVAAVLGFCSCVQIEPAASSFSVRGETETGSEGAILVEDYSQVDRPTWFGPSRSFRLDSAKRYLDYDGNPGIMFRISEKDEEAWGEFTESISPRRMALEVGGEIVSIIRVVERLPSRGFLANHVTGFTENEVSAYLAVLQAKATSKQGKL